MSSSIPQGSVPPEHNTNPSVLLGTDQAEAERLGKLNQKDKVDRGFSNQNSASLAPPKEDADFTAGTVRIEPPAEGADSPSGKVLKEVEVLKELTNFFKPGSKGQEVLTGGQLEQVGQEIFDKALKKLNPLAKHISTIQGNREHLHSLGYSDALIDGLLSLANPEDTDNSLSSMHSFSARLSGKLQGDPSLQNLHDLFGDVLTQFAGLEGGPPEVLDDIKASLQAFTSKHLSAGKILDVDAASLMLMELQTKLQNNRLVFSQETIKTLQVEREQQSKKRLDKIMESIEKAKEAEKSGMVGKIFGYIALAIMAIVTAVVTVVTGGAAAGLMVAALVIMVLMVASSESGTNFMTNWAGEDGELGMSIFWNVLAAVLTVGAGFAASAGSGASTAANAAGAGAKGAQVGASAATGASVAGKTAKLAAVAEKLTRWGQYAAGATMAADGAASAASTKYQFDADLLRADAKEIYAFILRNQQLIDENVEDIQKVIEELQQGYSTIASILKDNHDTKIKLLSYVKG
ncbi:type III secretion system translocon subunit SctE [Endozoicomonas ascidiicola]|uniref:type III secretion system translocon subunit SctE n=1 Tax=Endozoicomonas ascidiicola TaxID=1698521 RepID=UPI000830F638|nr:type III secretion system translocon subunit SctE [Endozoicomonas ascidiicola]